MIKEPEIVTISGTGRCGTNILKKILSQNNDVYSLPFEHRFTIDPGGLVDFYNQYTQTWSPYMTDTKIKQLETYLLSLAKCSLSNRLISKILDHFSDITNLPYARWELNKWFENYETEVKNLIDNLVEFKYEAHWPGSLPYKHKNLMYYGKKLSKKELASILGTFLNNIISATLVKNNRRVFVEDNTWSILFAKELTEITPQIKFIHLIRDPRDVIASMIKQKWCPNNLNDTIIYYKDLIDHINNVSQSLGPNNLLTLKFEELINKKTMIIKKICEFTGIKESSEMYEINTENHNIGNYKKILHRKDIDLIQKQLQDIINEYNKIILV